MRHRKRQSDSEGHQQLHIGPPSKGRNAPKKGRNAPRESKKPCHKTKLVKSNHLKNKTVMLAPAHGFYSKHNEIKNQVRIAYVLELKKLKSAIKIIDHGLSIY